MIYEVNLISRDTNGDATKTDITDVVLTGFSEVTKLDESLDIGSLIINGVTRETPYDMFDSIQVKIDGVEVFNQRISGDSIELISKSPKLYRHNISTVEHTKILELFVVNAKTFRNGIEDVDGYLGDYETVFDLDDGGIGEDFVNTQLLGIRPNATDGDFFFVYSTIQGLWGTYRFTTISPSAIFVEKNYIITTLGDTDWNAIAGTTGVTYAVGDIIDAKFVGSGTGTCSNYRLNGDTTKVYPNSYSLLDVVENLRDTVPFEMQDILNDYRVFTYTSSSDFYDLFEETESPEFTFKELNLRECLFQVGEYLDAIPRLKMVEVDEGLPTYDYSMELTWEFVNELKDLINSTDDYISTMRQQDIELYATQMESNVLNSVNDNSVNEAVETHPADGGWISPRTEQYIFDYTKSFIPTPKLVYSVVDVRYLMYGYILTSSTSGEFGSPGSPVFIEISLKNWITEWNKYRTKSEELRQELLFYQYRQPNIQLGTTYGLFDTLISFERVLEQSIIDKMIEEGFMKTRNEAGFSWSDENQSNWTKGYQLFQTDYIPIPNSSRYNIEKQDFSDVKKFSQISSNQQNRIVNLENFTNNMQSRINKIGNSELVLENRVVNYSSLNEIGDYTDDLYIITERELIFFKDYIFAKYQLSRNYNMISKFIGVNSEIRQWEIAEQDTLQRKLMYKEFVEIDIVEDVGGISGLNTSKLVTTDGIKCIMDTFNINSTYNSVKGGIIDSSETTDDLICDFSSNGGGNSLIFDFQFPSNNFVGNFIEAVTVGATQLANNFASYVDAFGKMETVDFYAFDKLDLVQTTYNDYLTLARNYPKTDKTDININYITNNSPFVVKKDNAEEIGGTLQLQFLSKEPNNVGLGRYLMRKNRLVSDRPPNKINLWYSNSNKFNRLDTLKIPSGWTKSTSTTTLNFDYVQRKITVTNTDLTSARASWALTDEQGNILVFRNQDGTLYNVITFDFNNKNSNVNYKY